MMICYSKHLPRTMSEVLLVQLNEEFCLAVYIASVGETINACTIDVREPRVKIGM
jgi:hypothetical protein